MIKKAYIVFILFVITVQGISFGQERLVTKANEKYEEYSFRPAIDIYKKVLDKGFVSADLLKKLGNSYYYNANYQEAAETYARLVTEFSDAIAPEDYFKYAQTLKTLGDYDASNEIMAKFTMLTTGDGRASAFKKERD